LIFKYAVAFHALALKTKGDEKERLDHEAEAYLKELLGNRYYVPSHELYLLRRCITEKFKANLADNLSKEAN